MKFKTYALLLLLLLPLLLAGCGSEDIEPSALSASSDVSEAVSEPVSEAEPVITWSGLYVSGKEAFEAGSYEEAIEIFTSAIEMNANLTGPFKYRAEAYWKLAETAAEEEALEYYRLAGDDYSAVVALGVDTADLHRLSGDSYYRANEYEKAWEHYSILMEGGETVDDEALIACSAYAEDSAQIAKLCLQKYFETKDSKYYDAMVSCWPTEVLQAYGDFLGLDDEMVFALLDWNMDGIPEMIAGKNGGQSVGKDTIWGDYIAYTYLDGEVRPIYRGYMNGSVYTPTFNSHGFFLEYSSGNGGYAMMEFLKMIEDGAVISYVFEQWQGVTPEGELGFVYRAGPWTEEVTGAWGNDYRTDAIVSEATYNEQLETYNSDASYEINFIANTPENSLKYLHTDQAQKQQEAAAVLEEVRVNVAVYNEWISYGFSAQWDKSDLHHRTVIRNSDETARDPYRWSVTSRVYRADEDIELLENEEWDSINLSYYPVKNFKSIDEMYNYSARYISGELIEKEMLLPYFEEVNGVLYYASDAWGLPLSYDINTLKIVDFDDNTCAATCIQPAPNITMGDQTHQLTFQKGANGWILTEVKEV